MAYIAGTQAATALFEKGLWFDAVVRGLIEELGLTNEEATLAARAAAHERPVAPMPPDS